MARIATKEGPRPTPVDLSKTLGVARNRVYMVGIELEGGWTKLPDKTTLVHDGSVRIPGPQLDRTQLRAYEVLTARLREGARFNAEETALYNQLHAIYRGAGVMTGELPSPPLSLDDFEKWMRVFYPQKVNETCGMHVHMSFKSALTYQRLMVPSYQATVVEYFGRWAKKEDLAPEHPIWGRLTGQSRYCQLKFYADTQAKHTQKTHDQQTVGHRYTAINYCYSRYRTIECRLLPMMEGVDQGIRAVRELIAITNAFLVSTAKKEKKENAHILVENDTLVEEYNVYV